ncbi:MAG: thiamine-phosphate synthase [[Candidatus Thermochlorobacteriaceae] bacterium GBChlB]|nr:MAG: thiamine-phosphate synthase [[Candidatus Thermochlorobacteriaceae] bacterium GBChlB]
MKRLISGLCVITDTAVQQRFSHVQLAELSMQGGADIVQLRGKALSTKDLFASAVGIRALSLAYGTVFIVNDRADIALASNADGVHLGQTDLPIAAARKILGNDKLIGATASTIDDALKAEQDGADYIGFGHIFSTTSKEKLTPPTGVAMLRDVLQAVKIPVMAIGGINQKNIESVWQTGVQSVAVISAVASAETPKAATAQLKKILTPL